jgi:hypothetical protein
MGKSGADRYVGTVSKLRIFNHLFYLQCRYPWIHSEASLLIPSTLDHISLLSYIMLYHQPLHPWLTNIRFRHEGVFCNVRKQH